MTAEWTPQVGETVVDRNGGVSEVVAVRSVAARGLEVVTWDDNHGFLIRVRDRLSPLPPKPIQYLVTCEERPASAQECYVALGFGFEPKIFHPAGGTCGASVHVITKVEPLGEPDRVR